MRFLLGVLTGLVFTAALAVVATVGPGPLWSALRSAMPEGRDAPIAALQEGGPQEGAFRLLASRSAPQDAPPVALQETAFRLSALRPTTQYDAPVGAFRRFEAQIGEQTRVWHGFGPAAGPEAELRPAVVLLHGSQRNGAAMIDMWRAAAAAHGLVLIAPDAVTPAVWSERQTSNAVLAGIVAEAAEQFAVDPSRLYLFGHSAGAGLALSLAMAQDGPWQAVAVHAGTLSEGQITAARQGAAPITIFIGDEDAFFPLDQVREAAQAMAAQGHRTELVVMPEHDHWYYDIGPRLSSEVYRRWQAAGASG